MAKVKAPKLKAMLMMASEGKADMKNDKKLGLKESPIESKEVAANKKKKPVAKKTLPWSSQNKSVKKGC